MLREVHEDYIRAGASVIIANTYASNRIMLEPAGLGGEFESHQPRRAVEIALEARERAGGGDPVAVAGSMSHMVPMRHDPAWAPSPARAAECFSEMAETLAAAGADLIIMEMMSNPDLARPAIAARARDRVAGLGRVQRATRRARRAGPPSSARTSVSRSSSTPSTRRRRRSRGSCTPTSISPVPALAALRDRFDGPLLAYPDSGYFEMPHWRFVDIVSPEKLASAARGWIEEDGVQLVGGCCGLGLEHVEALAEMLAAR